MAAHEPLRARGALREDLGLVPDATALLATKRKSAASASPLRPHSRYTREHGDYFENELAFKRRCLTRDA